MPREAIQISLNEKNFMVFALKQNQRIDGRGLYDMRNLHIAFGKEIGTVEVQLGMTRVMTSIAAELAAPYPDRPMEGSFAVFTEFSPMADPKFELEKRSDDSVELSRIIDRGLRNSKALDLESLCVLPGKSVWNLRLNVHVLDNDGNLVDAANFCSIISLLCFRRPECSVDTNLHVVIHPIEERDPIPLSLHHIPLSITFAFFNNGIDMIIDPNLKEDICCEGKLTMCMNVQGEICALQKAGGVPIDASEIFRAARIAAAKVLDLTEQIKSAVELHDKERQLQKVKRKRQSQGGEVKDPFFFSGVAISDKDLKQLDRRNVMDENSDEDAVNISEDDESEDVELEGAEHKMLEDGEIDGEEEEEEEEEGEEGISEEKEIKIEEEEETDQVKREMEVDDTVDSKNNLNVSEIHQNSAVKNNKAIKESKHKKLQKKDYFQGGVSSWFDEKDTKIGQSNKIESQCMDEFDKVAELLSSKMGKKIQPISKMPSETAHASDIANVAAARVYAAARAEANEELRTEPVAQVLVPKALVSQPLGPVFPSDLHAELSQDSLTTSVKIKSKKNKSRR